MARREVCFLIDENGTVLWSDASGSEAALADSRVRWEKIWELRDVLTEIAHSHPMGGAFFSAEDESTMRALTSALGRSLRFSVVTPDGVLARDGGRDAIVEPEPPWAKLLRTESGMYEVSAGDEGDVAKSPEGEKEE
jgi:hypothetical protein